MQREQREIPILCPRFLPPNLMMLPNQPLSPLLSVLRPHHAILLPPIRPSRILLQHIEPHTVQRALMRTLQLNPRHIVDVLVDRAFPRRGLHAQARAGLDARGAQVGALARGEVEERGCEERGDGVRGRAHAAFYGGGERVGCGGGVLVERGVEDWGYVLVVVAGVEEVCGVFTILLLYVH